MTESLTYVYCLVRSARRPAMRRLPAGVPAAAPPRLLDVGRGVWAIVATVPGRGYEETTITRGLRNLDWVGRHAMAHEQMVEHFLHAGDVLPMQLFTLFASDARVIEHVARDRARIDAILARIAGRLEWGLRLTFDEKAAQRAVERRHAAGNGSSRPRDASGVAYLSRKRDLRDVTRGELDAARAEADRVYRAVSQDADEHRRRPDLEQTPGGRLLLDAAFLVASRRSPRFRAAVRRHTKSLSSGIVVSVTGPWPPYNFIDAPRTTPGRSRTTRSRTTRTAPRGTAARSRTAR